MHNERVLKDYIQAKLRISGHIAEDSTAEVLLAPDGSVFAEIEKRADGTLGRTLYGSLSGGDSGAEGGGPVNITVHSASTAEGGGDDGTQETG